MQRTCCGNDHCGCQRCGRVLQVGSKPAPPFRHTGRDATIWWHGKLTPILHDMPVERCCSTSSGAASTTATHTACNHHCCGSAPSPAAAAIRKFRPGTTTRGHHSRAASISPLREENDLHGSICEIIGPRAVCERTTMCRAMCLRKERLVLFCACLISRGKWEKSHPKVGYPTFDYGWAQV